MTGEGLRTLLLGNDGLSAAALAQLAEAEARAVLPLLREMETAGRVMALYRLIHAVLVVAIIFAVLAVIFAGWLIVIAVGVLHPKLSPRRASTGSRVSTGRRRSC